MRLPTSSHVFGLLDGDVAGMPREGKKGRKNRLVLGEVGGMGNGLDFVCMCVFVGWFILICVCVCVIIFFPFFFFFCSCL